jgi:hypothetical protein
MGWLPHLFQLLYAQQGQYSQPKSRGCTLRRHFQLRIRRRVPPQRTAVILAALHHIDRKVVHLTLVWGSAIFWIVLKYGVYPFDLLKWIPGANAG